jgi:uncharacterized membrane protein YhaH (DUF805 family)/predicted RNA-binding Zn-ribbon protein involved in translation (DUF1610 family)
MACGAPPKKTKNNSTPHDDLRSHVTFGSANYTAQCPSCGNQYLARGKTLQTKDSIKCPHPGCGIFTPTRKLPIELSKEEIITYSIVGDFFSFSGRLSIENYWISFLISIPPLIGVFLILLFDFKLFAFFYIIALIVLLPLWIKRYHDLGMNSKWAIIQGAFFYHLFYSFFEYSQGRSDVSSDTIVIILKFFLGIALLVTSVFLFLIPGEKKINRYGPPSSKIRIRWL